MLYKDLMLGLYFFAIDMRGNLCYILSMEENKVENSSMCAKCGGLCCQKSGCGYIVKDIKSFKFVDLKALLDEGNISISAILRKGFVGGRLKTEKILVLKARSIDKGIVDLVSASTQCKMWTPKGCSYSLADRPSLGAGLIPDINQGCRRNIYDYDKVLDEWKEHQAGLEKLVKLYTGKKMEYVYEEQFIKTVALVWAKRTLARGDISLLTIGEQEILSMIVEASDDMAYEIKQAKELAAKFVKNAIKNAEQS